MKDQPELPASLKPAVRELQAVLEKLKVVPDAVITQTFNAQASVMARYQPVFSSENITSITEEEFKSFLLFENNQHWWGLHRQGSYITTDMPLLRKALAILVNESKALPKQM